MKDHQQIPVSAGSEPTRIEAALHCARAKVLFAGAVSAALLLVAGCGSQSGPGSSSAGTVASVAVQRVADTTPAADVKAQHHERAVRAREARRLASNRRTERYLPPRITTGHHVQRPAEGTGGNAVNDDNPASRASSADSGRPSAGGKPNPCALVSIAQAQAITGRTVAVTEAPLGPTCIYHEAGVKTPVTLTVELARFAALKAHIKHGSNFTVGGRPGVCARYSGSAVTYVALSGTRVLNVFGPCPVGEKFAIAAVAKLG
jgi:hypothetical protein